MGTKDINDIRRTNLNELIEDKYQGNRSAFARASGKNVNLVNLVLSHNPEYRRSIGEKLARSIEEVMSLPAGWLDVDRASVNSLTAVHRYRSRAHDDDMIPEALYVGSKWLTARAGSLTDKANLALWHMHDDTMSPTVNAGDAVLVDTGRSRDGAGLYLIEHDGLQEIRRLSYRPDGTVSVATDNALYDSVILDPKKAAKLNIIGRVIGRISYNAL